MGATRGWKQGRPAVAIAAVLFYAFLSSWLPAGFASPYGNVYQQAVVLDLPDDVDDDPPTGPGELAAPAGHSTPGPGWPAGPAAGPDRAPRIFAPPLARARDPPSLNA